MIASGATGDCGSSPIDWAIFLVGMRASSVPSSRTAPPRGFSRRPRARSVVDLPHAFGPTMTVKERSGIDTDRFSAMTRRSYPRVTDSAASRADPAPAPAADGIDLSPPGGVRERGGTWSPVARPAGSIDLSVPRLTRALPYSFLPVFSPGGLL